MTVTQKLVVVCALYMIIGAVFPATAQNRVVTQHTTGTVVEGDVTMLVTQETTARYRRTTSQGVPDAKLGYTPGVTPEHLALPLAETVMARYPDYRMAYWKDYTYVQGYMFEAMDRMGQLTGDGKYLEYMKKYMDHFVDEDGNYKGGGLTNLDNFMTGSVFCTLYGRTGDEKYKKAALQILKAVDKYPSSDGQFWHGNRSPNMWIDGVFMMQMFLIRCAQYVGEADYCYDVACRNIIAAARHLQRPDGLILHAWTTEPEKAAWADKSTGLSPEVWSEGMGWYTLVVPELLALLPKTHPGYQQVLDIYLKMCKGLKEMQDKKTGGWFMVVDKGENPLNFVDPSGTAMFVYSIQRGVQLGLLKAKEYAPVAKRGYQSLFPFIQVNGKGLLDVIGACDGVVIKKNFVEYVTVPKILNAKEAVAGILWASVIMETEQLSVSVQAGNTDELVRIKQNYSRMLVPSGKDPFGLLSVLSSIQPEKEISDQAVVELHQRYPFDLKKIKVYLSSFTEAGTWPDIDYNDKKRSGWEPKLHAERILELVKLYNSGQTSYYHSQEVETVIHKALDYWFTAKPVCLNWWYNQIGIPKTLGTAFILFEQRLTPAEKQQAITVMENAKFGMTGQNKVWLAGNVMMRALLQNDYALVKMARDTIASEIVTGGAEGIKDDWCFHQHGAQQQFGNYGLSFVSGMSFFSGLFSGTSLAFDDKQLRILSTLIDKGYRWVIWKGMMDVNALGRQLFHHAPVHKALSLAFAASELGGGESDECMAVARALLRDNYPVPTTNVLTGHKYFWQSDYTIYRRPLWMASIKMASDRIVGVEMMNGDNMKGYYMADGATYIYKDGKEYLDIFPLWDWRKLPGVTAFEDDAPMPLIKSYRPRNEGTFVGAVSDEKQGMTAMELNRAGMKAHKAWICTDDFVLCLGAGIEADSNLVVTTSIEQCHKNGDLLCWNKGEWNVVGAKQSATEKEQRFFHNNTGYIVWGNQGEVVAETAKRTGRWYDVMQMYRPEEVHGEVTSIYLKHGVAPKQGTYQYLILPATDKKGVATFNVADIRVLRNDATVQAVYTEDNSTCWLAAYQPVQLAVTSGLTLDIQTPGIYMIRESTSGQYQVSYADPTQQRDTAVLELNHKKVHIPLPEGKEKGKTVSIVV